MSELALHGIGVLSAAGYEATDVAACVDDPSSVPLADAAGLFDEDVPDAHARVLADFAVRDHLGRKGTSTFDRATALGVVACQRAIADAGLEVSEQTAQRIGAVIGTTVGSFKSTSDFTKDTLVNDKPYLVNPSQFPNTIMNGAAGQIAIRFGLRGVNATLAGGPAGFLHALHYARSIIGRGYVDTVLAGGVEEFSPHRAWLAHASGTPAPGEAAVVACLSRPPAENADGAEGAQLTVLSTATAFGPTPEAADTALERCVARVLAQAKLDASRVQLVFTGDRPSATDLEFDRVAAALGGAPAHVRVGDALGDCGAATAGLSLVVARERRDSFEHCLLTARDPDGGVAVALLRSGAAA